MSYLIGTRYKTLVQMFHSAAKCYEADMLITILIKDPSNRYKIVIYSLKHYENDKCFS